jgi:CheY-like chemotaxis protein
MISFLNPLFSKDLDRERLAAKPKFFGEPMKRQALIVEDEAALRLMYELVLNSMGFDVIHAGDGNEAMAVLQESAPEVVFLDMLLPNLNGKTVLDYIHTAAHLENTHVIIVSAHAHFEELCFSSDQFLLKPILSGHIREAVKRAQCLQ